MTTSIVIVFAVTTALIIWWVVRTNAKERTEADRQAERVRIQRIQRQSEVQLDALMQAALQEMVKVASVHRPGCRCLLNERDLL